MITAKRRLGLIIAWLSQLLVEAWLLFMSTAIAQGQLPGLVKRYVVVTNIATYVTHFLQAAQVKNFT